MSKYKFAASEYCFPIWGSMAVRMAAEAGFDGIEITDGGGYLQPHPDNNGYVEYERLGLDMTRQDSFPLTDRPVQEDYLNAAARYGISITGIYLYLLENQGFIKNDSRGICGKHCLETISNAIKCASRMNIPSVTISARGLFGTAQYEYAFQKIKFAAEEAAASGTAIYIISDRPWTEQKTVLDRTGKKALASLCILDPVVSASGDPAEGIAGLGREYIGQVRAQDIKADADGFLTRGGAPALPGQGDTDMSASAAALRSSGYDGWIISQTPYYSSLLTPVGEDFTETAAKDLAALKKIFDSKQGGKL